MISDFSSTHLTQLWGVQDLVFVSSLMIFICRFVRKYALGPEPWSVTTAQYVTTPTPTPCEQLQRLAAAAARRGPAASPLPAAAAGGP